MGTPNPDNLLGHNATAMFRTAMMSSSRFIWITNSSDHRRGLNCKSLAYKVVT